MLQEYVNPPEKFAIGVRESIDNEVAKGSTLTEKGHLFLHWALTNVFHSTRDDAANAVVDSPGDYGIDAVLEIQGSDMSFFRMFVAKHGQSHSLNDVHACKANFNWLLKQNPSDLGQGRIREVLINIKKKGLDCEAVYLTDQDVEFDSTDNFHVYGFRQIVDKMWNDIPEPFTNKAETIKLEKYMKYDNAIIGVISLNELSRLINLTRKYIFESNMRKFLTTKTLVNKQLRKSLQNGPEEFFYYNNGVTMVVKGFEESDNNTIKIHEPQIVNGVHTSTTIADVVNRDPTIKGSVQLTIITKTPKTTRDNITRYRNSQNAVRGKDLISLAKFHDAIHTQLKSKLGYYYYQHAASWFDMSDAEKEFYKGHGIFNQYLPPHHEKKISANDAIQAMVAAIEQDPVTPYGTVSKYMPGEKNTRRFLSRIVCLTIIDCYSIRILLSATVEKSSNTEV